MKSLENIIDRHTGINPADCWVQRRW